jgi:hypothetical protein|tara:strand:+ start:474 stop:1001 length:528 start_codon:yes stop_codon:yes gene_type:complete
MTKNNNKEHYVNNKEFLNELVEYKQEVENSYIKQFGSIPEDKKDRVRYWEGKPKIPNYLGDCFLKIATHLSYKPNFINYMFREEMISDGIENCIQYVDNFDPRKSTNAFSYFTQIIYFAFLRRIQKEKRQLDIKNKIMEKSGYDVAFDVDKGVLTGYDSEYNYIKDSLYTKIKNK